ncbi:L-seryl-tRNA(Sec) selenium transferase [Halalkalibacillus sediminis]|uniref:L-seryl-tRNA(Sec) selenium transferase n=1 Tax=Halalkalibacillus sediminis TaxID=2018042 RepID=A0A2I0QWN4_9BACI|nr:L-seryl-tRNA(Sec) selenium transferase [Halalkalibacillus sediminis]PKR78724.1 L-seryl-tRNA(Sec) selenium transferase [Halalkalibacillus sediminis]
MSRESLRKIPPVHQILSSKKLTTFAQDQHLPQQLLKSSVQKVVDELRQELIKKTGDELNTDDFESLITDRVIVKVNDYFSPNLKRVINATGTVLHTNLGRARLAEQAVSRVTDVARNYSTLEYDQSRGKRGSRHRLVEDYICELTGAEAAIVVNNNAASVYMVLSAFSKGYEAIVSRGELVEIGGSFRVSSIMEESGTSLREVGTTNKTHLSDYEQAISDKTKMLMKVHTSNFHMIGFTEEVDRKELSALAKREGILYFEDLGSGMLYDLTSCGIGSEPLVKEVAEHADLVSFSADKLLGGPQAGIIAGKKHLIDQLKKHQLARVLRIDKMSYAALEETLKLTLKDSETSKKEIPTLRDILQTQAQIKNRVEIFLNDLPSSTDMEVTPVELQSQVGGGTLPEVVLDSYGVSLRVKNKIAEKLATELRSAHIPIVSRIDHESVLLDFRTIDISEERDLKQAIKTIMETL